MLCLVGNRIIGSVCLLYVCFVALYSRPSEHKTHDNQLIYFQVHNSKSSIITYDIFIIIIIIIISSSSSIQTLGQFGQEPEPS
jgi:heme/copper-type cytochrome/quinol oxidase subunit 2